MTVGFFFLLAGQTVFAQAPAIASFSPASGPVGTMVTITGANLGNLATFTIGGATAIVVSNTGTQLVGMVMPGAATGAISVATNGGNATTAGNFTVTPTPFPISQQDNELTGNGAATPAAQASYVAISADGNTAAVSTSVDTGAVWIYVRNGGTWAQQGNKIVIIGAGSALNAVAGTNAVALSADGNTLLVGKNSDNLGVGAAWVYTRTAGVWSQQVKLVGTGYITGDPASEGTSVALSADGNTAVVGGPNDNNYAGATWVFTRSNGSWAQQGSKLAGTGGMGYSVAISADGKTIAAGAPNDASYTGTISIYTLNTGAWVQQGSKLIGANYTTNANQGWAVALSADGNTLAEGGPQQTVNATNGTNAGSVWIFTRTGTTWTQQGSMLNSNDFVGNANQGWSLSLSADGNILAFGGDADNRSVGATWIFTRSAGTWTQSGPKNIGANSATSPTTQGYSVALSADGSTMIEGGDYYSPGGSAWVFSNSSPDATLSDLTLSSGTLSPAFAPATNAYNVSVPNTTSSVTVTPTTKIIGATVKINGTAVTTGSASAAINLKAGANTISVVATSNDGTTTDSYTLTVIRASVTAPNISYAGPQTYPAAVKISALSPTNTGGGVPAIGFSQTATFEKGVISPVGVVVDASGNVFTSSGRYIWKIVPGGQPVVFAGSGAEGNTNGQGAAASFGAVVGLAMDAQGNIYAADADNNMIRKITPDGLVSTFAGSGTAGLTDGNASQASFNTPWGLAIGPDGSIYVTDVENKAIRKITTAGVVSTIAVSSTTDVNYMFSFGMGIAVDGANNIYTVDQSYFVIRKFTQAGAMSIVAGINAKQGYVDGSVISAQFYSPYGITLDAQNNLYVSDYYGMREITTDGNVATIAGFGGPGGPTTSVDGIGQAAIFQGGSRQITADGKGKLYLAELNNSAIRTISYVGYAIDNTLPTGLTFNYLTGGITGTPTTISPAANYVVAGYNLGGKSTANVNITVTANADMASLKLSKGTLSPVFAPGTTSYSVLETNSTASVTVTPTAVDPLATITVNGTAVKSGNPSGVIALSVGSNIIITKVTGQDGATTQSDTLTVIRPSTNAKLASLKVSSGTLTPAFNTNTTSYTLAVPYTTSSLTTTPTVAVTGATVTVNGATLTSGNTSGPIALNIGSNTISTVVTAQDGVTTDTYTITVTRAAASSNASLGNLVISKGTLNPVFTSTTGSYTDIVTNGTTSLTVTPTAADATASIMVNGSPVISGKASGAVALAIGTNTVSVVITAQDGSTSQSYMVTVIRPSTNAKLAGLVLSSGTLSPAFNGATVTYTASVPYTSSTIAVTPTVAVAGATVTVNGSAVTTGNASAPVSLAVGANKITTIVTAQDGVTTDTYTLTVTRAAASTNDNLSALTISKGSLSPTFATTTTGYTDFVTNGTASVTVTPTLADASATVTVNGTLVTTGKASGAITLSVGNNAINIVVTAQSGASQTYTVSVTRPSTNAKLSALTISSGTLTPAFNANTTSYTASVTNATASVTITPTIAVSGATITVNGAAVISGSPSGAIALSVGANTITTTVTAQDGVTTDTYTITVTRAAAGENTPDAAITVGVQNFEPQLADDGVNVHQGISPNGDGVDDYLQIDNINQYPDNHLVIMNRNGQPVFEAKGYDNAIKAFDGHSNKTGQMQLPGTYFYSLDYTVKGIVKRKTGFLVLKY